MSTLTLFRNRFVQAILASDLLLQLGIWIRNFAILLFVVEQTDEDPVAVSMISIAEYLPIFIFSFVGGTFADRWRPKQTMIWCEICSAISVFLIFLALLFTSWHVVFFATLISSILSQFSLPSGMKLFKQHLEGDQMQAAISLYQTITSVFIIIGPILGTYVYQTFGIHTSLVLTGISFFLAAVVLIWIPNHPTVKDAESSNSMEKNSVWSDLLSGFRYVFSKQILTLLSLCYFLAGLAIGLTQPLAIFLVTEQLSLPKEFLQWLLTANGTGMVLGGITTMLLAKWISPPRLIILGLGVIAIGASVVGFSTELWLTMLGQLICGIMLPGIHIGGNTTILQHTDNNYIGRVNGILNPMFTGAMVITMSIAGLLKNYLSIMIIFQITAILFLFSMIAILPLYRLPTPKAENVQQM